MSVMKYFNIKDNFEAECVLCLPKKHILTYVRVRNIKLHFNRYHKNIKEEHWTSKYFKKCVHDTSFATCQILECQKKIFINYSQKYSNLTGHLKTHGIKKPEHPLSKTTRRRYDSSEFLWKYVEKYDNFNVTCLECKKQNTMRIIKLQITPHLSDHLKLKHEKTIVRESNDISESSTSTQN